MAGKLRLESEGGVYHVLNRGNYRGHIFRTEKTKAAFLKCLGETCAKTGWRVHAWCLMSNHYHLALETPRANLVAGLRWLQDMFATRFNRLREERGHLFQGPTRACWSIRRADWGPLCHCIHLNPVRARLRSVPQLPWSSLARLTDPKLRPAWYEPVAALDHAGGLKDTPAGRKKYLDYLTWLPEAEPARKEQRFSEMPKGWLIGTGEFTKAMVREHSEVAGQGRRRAGELQVAQEAVWQDHGAFAAHAGSIGKRRRGRRKVVRLEARGGRGAEGPHDGDQPLAWHRPASGQTA